MLLLNLMYSTHNTQYICFTVIVATAATAAAWVPRCGHCKKLEPEYEKAALDLAKDNLVLAKVKLHKAGTPIPPPPLGVGTVLAASKVMRGQWSNG